MKQQKKKTDFPFKKEGSALAVILFILAVLFAAVRALQPPAQSKPADAPQTVEQQSIRQELPEPPQTFPSPETTQTTSAAPETTQPDAETDKVVYLTFDDGPTSNTTHILDALDEGGAKATFFVIHTYDGCEKQIKEIYDRGHRIALHSYTHQYEIYRSEKTYFEDLEKISDLVFKATGERSKLIRFPGGSSNTISRKYCQGIMSTLTKAVTEKGYVYFDWDWDSMDASSAGKDAASITQYATRPIGQDDHIILLMHDSATKKATANAIPDIVRAYKQAGYRFGLLSKDSYVYHHSVNN